MGRALRLAECFPFPAGHGRRPLAQVRLCCCEALPFLLCTEPLYAKKVKMILHDSSSFQPLLSAAVLGWWQSTGQSTSLEAQRQWVSSVLDIAGRGKLFPSMKILMMLT